MPLSFSIFSLDNFTVRGLEYSKTKSGTPYAIVNFENVAKGEYLIALDFDLIISKGGYRSKLQIGRVYNVTLEHRAAYSYILLLWYKEVQK